jgi:hypothetical protein
MKGTGTGEVIIPGYASYIGIPEKDFIAMIFQISDMACTMTG